MSGFLASRRRSIALVVGSMFVAVQASAWDVSVGTFFLDNALYVESWSGPGFSFTTIDERVRAADVPGTSLPIFWNAQTWDSDLGEWPQADLTVSQGATFASLFNDDVTTEKWTSAEAAVFGALAVGRAAGSGVAYDFDFVVQPFTTGNLFLDPGETYVRLASEPGDVGSAFATIRLYRPDVDLNAPGGVNAPLAQSAHALAAGNAPIEANPTFSWSFQNATGSPQTTRLRLELSTSVLSVPEPAGAAGLAAGVIGLLGVGRRARRADGARCPRRV